MSYTAHRPQTAAQVLAQTRRHRYYAWACRSGGVLWMSKPIHDAMQCRPHTIPLHHCSHYLGKTRLMTQAQWLEERRQRSQGLGG